MKKFFIALFLFILSFCFYFNDYEIKSAQCLSTYIDTDESLAIVQDYVAKAGYSYEAVFTDEITVPDNDMYPLELRKQTLKVYDLSAPLYDGEFYLNETDSNVYEYVNDIWICHSDNMKVISPGYIDFQGFSDSDLNTLKGQGVTDIGKYLSNKDIDFLSFDYFNEGSHHPQALKYKSMLRYEVSDSLTTSYVFYNPETKDVFEEIDGGFIWHNMYKTVR